MPILVDKVRVLNFRSLNKCSITLTPMTLLIGANNSGKTSFLRALNLALGAGPKRVAREDFYFGEKNTEGEPKEIIIVVRHGPSDVEGDSVASLDDTWTDTPFGDLTSG